MSLAGRLKWKGALYIVDIMVDEQGEPSYMECDCLYERNCKHSAAVLYAIRKELKKPETQWNGNSQKKKASLKELLQQQTKEQLIQLILSA